MPVPSPQSPVPALHEPDHPLVVLIFGDARAYAAFAAADAGPELSDRPGYYSIRTNCIVLCGVDSQEPSVQSRKRRGRPRDSGLSTLDFRANLLHEGTHQLAFNCGMHARYADLPVWLTEGMAMVFEAANERWLSSLSVGRSTNHRPPVNRARLVTFRKFLRVRPDDSLTGLIASDERFRDAKTSSAAYAEAWALTHVLLSSRREKYLEYLRQMQEKAPLVRETSQARTARFQAVFGDIGRLDREVLRSIRRQR